VLLMVGVAAAVGAVAVTAAPNSVDRAAATAAALLAVAAYVCCRIPLLHLAACGSLAFTSQAWLSWAIPTVISVRSLPDGPDVVSNPAPAIGPSFSVIATVWALLAINGILDERHLGLLSAGALFFIGAERLATDTATQHAWTNAAGYLLLGLLAVTGLVGYVRTR
jgi:hypothetical protein